LFVSVLYKYMTVAPRRKHSSPSMPKLSVTQFMIPVIVFPPMDRIESESIR